MLNGNKTILIAREHPMSNLTKYVWNKNTRKHAKEYPHIGAMFACCFTMLFTFTIKVSQEQSALTVFELQNLA